MYFIKFENKDNIVSLESQTRTDLYCKILQWLHNNDYSFTGNIHKGFIKRILSKEEVDSSPYTKNRFYRFEGTNDYFYLYRNKDVEKFWEKMLINFGIDDSSISIKQEGVHINDESEKNDINLESDFDNFKIKRFGTFNNFKATQSQEEIESKDFSKNPFRQAICVLGGSGAGKSTTIENILESEGHEFEFIIPSASTTGLLSQFSPSKSGYVPSKLGKMILKAYDNPTKLFTAVFDECHKSNVIEMINDELLQAISTKRNAGKRFISLDDDTAELYPGTETHRGNILMPDNLGFIFISSKPDVILHNDDFFNRIDIVLLKSYEEERLSTIDQLLGKVLSSTEKDSLKSNNE